MPALSSASASPRVLQLGPLYNNHLRRWSAHAAALGCHVLAAGHVRADRKPVDLAGIADRVEVAPDHISVADHDMQARWLDGVIDGLEPDLIQAHWLPRWGYLAARCGHPRVAVTAWGSDIYLAAGAERSRADEALLGTRHLIARSAHMRRAMLARGARTDHIWRVDLGVDLERFRPAGSEEQRQIRARLRLPDGPVLLSLRAPTDLYNLDVVIEAFTRVRACWPESTLVLITGDAPFSERTKAALADTPGVRVIGQVPHADRPDYLEHAAGYFSAREGPLPLWVNGQGGEIARAYYSSRDGGNRDGVLGGLVARVAGGARLLNKHARALVQVELGRAVDEAMAAGVAARDVPDVFYLRHRMAGWAAIGHGCVSTKGDNSCGAIPHWDRRYGQNSSRNGYNAVLQAIPGRLCEHRCPAPVTAARGRLCQRHQTCARGPCGARVSAAMRAPRSRRHVRVAAASARLAGDRRARMDLAPGHRVPRAQLSSGSSAAQLRS